MTDTDRNAPTSIEQQLEMARNAEESGHIQEAISLYNAILDTDATNVTALEALCLLRRDMGMTEDALRLARALCHHRPDCGAELMVDLLMDTDGPQAAREFAATLTLDDSTAARVDQLLSRVPAAGDSRRTETEDIDLPTDVTETDLTLMLDLFSGREGVYARQWCAPDGRTGYSPVHRPLTGSLLRQHLGGDATIGVYTLRRDNQVLFWALDVDADIDTLDTVEARDEALHCARSFLLRLAEHCRRIGLPVLLEWSGYKGYHLWCFLDEPWPAHKARRLARHILAAVGEVPPSIHVDVFPAQNHVKPGGLGNLIKLPLGVHRRSGRRSTLLEPSGSRNTTPFVLLREVRRVSMETLEDLFATVQTDSSELVRGATGRSAAAADEAALTEEDAAVHSRAQGIPEDDYDLDNDEELAFLCARCGAIATLVNRCRAGERLTHHQQTVLTYTVGHLTHGPRAVNALLETAAQGFVRLKGRLRGHPTSCRKIRQHLGLFDGEAGCVCSFDPTLGTYPHPLLHLAALRAARQAAVADVSREATLRELNRIDDEIRRLSRMADVLKQQLTEATGGESSSVKTPGDTGFAVFGSGQPPEA